MTPTEALAAITAYCDQADRTEFPMLMVRSVRAILARVERDRPVALDRDAALTVLLSLTPPLPRPEIDAALDRLAALVRPEAAQ